MPVENATYISELNPDWPVGKSDFVSEGDDHFRMMKKTLQNTLPNADDPITGTPAQLNNLTNGINWVDNSATAGAASYFEVTDPTSTDDTKPDAPLVVGTPTVEQYNSTPGLSLTWQALMDIIHPVGGIYASATDNRNPADILGFGTWEPLTGFLAGIGSANNADDVPLNIAPGAGQGRAYVNRANITGEQITPSGTLAMDALPPHQHQTAEGNDGGNTPAFGNAPFAGVALSPDGWSDGYPYSALTAGASAGTPTGTFQGAPLALGTQSEPFAPSYTGVYIWTRTA